MNKYESEYFLLTQLCDCISAVPEKNGVYIYYYIYVPRQERPYHDDSTASRLLSEVKHHRAWLVLRWGTTLESQVLFFCSQKEM